MVKGELYSTGSPDVERGLDGRSLPLSRSAPRRASARRLGLRR